MPLNPVMSSRCFVYIIVRYDVIAGGDVDCACDVVCPSGCDVRSFRDIGHAINARVHGRRLTSIDVSNSLRPLNGVIIICTFATSITALTSRSNGWPRITSQSSNTTIKNEACLSCVPILIFVLM